MLRVPQRQVTLDAWLFFGLLILASALRFFRLDLQPLSPNESPHALAALQLIRGDIPGLWDAPALVLSTAGGLFLFGAVDAVARMASALAGAGLIAALWLYRGLLGRGTVLLCTALVALSPTAVTVARTISSENLSALLTLLLGWGLVRFWKEDHGAFPGLGAAIVAILLNLGYAGLTDVMALTLFAVGYGVLQPQVSYSSAPVWLKHYQRLSFAFLGTFLLVSTGLFLFLGGFGLPASTVWTRHFVPAQPGFPWYHPWLLLAGYELPMTAIGIPAILHTLYRWVAAPANEGRAVAALFAIWALLGLLFFLLGGEPTTASMFQAVFPLTLVTGIVIARGLAGFEARLWKTIGTPAAPLLALLGFAGLTLSGLAQDSTLFNGAGTLLALAAIGLAVTILLLSASISGRPWAVLSIASISLTALLTMHSLSKMAFSDPWPGAQEIQSNGVASITDPVRLMPYTVEGKQRDVSVEKDLAKVVGWYLRDVPQVVYPSRVQPGPDVLVARRDSLVAGIPGYQQQVIPLAHAWTPTEWSWRELWRWFLFGETPPEQGVSQWVTVFVRT